MERRPSDAMYYAGGFLTLTFAGDSAVLIEERFTDDIMCRIIEADRQCTDSRWQNRFVGPYSMDDSSLTLHFAFAGTTANPMTENDHADAWVAVSRYAWDSRDPRSLTLTALGGGDVFPGRKSLEFSAKAKANPE